MTVMTETIAHTVAARAGAARHLALAKAARALARADKALTKATKAQTKLAGNAMLENAALKARMSAGMSKGAAKLAAKSGTARSAATTAAKVAKVAAMNMPTAWMINRRIERAREAARSASREASKQLHQARVVVQESVIPTVIPMASSAIDQASHRFDEFMVASAPARKEAIRRGTLAAAVLRGAEPVAAKPRRWPIAIMALAIGGVVGAAVAWLSQAGKPVQLTPYPIPAEEGDQTVDLTSEDAARHEI